MDAQELLRLNRGGETATFDRKLECAACRGEAKSNAELVKDICAMANNGARRSYIAIGISDDGKVFQSVTNDRLSEDNLRSLIKTTISPIPAISLKALRLKRGSKVVTLKIITIGKNKRQAFRLAADLISYKDKFAFRRNEVWIRRGATSDLATPEEVMKLVMGQDVDDPLSEISNVVYGHVPMHERKEAILKDAADASDGFIIHAEAEVALMEVLGNTFVSRLMYLEHLPHGPKTRFLINFIRDWGFEHGVIQLSVDKLSAKYFAPHPFGSADGEFSVLSKEKWGTFGVVELAGSGGKSSRRPGSISPMMKKTLKNGPALRIPVFVIAGIKDRHSLVRRIRSLLEFINSPRIGGILVSARDALEIALSSVVKERKAYVQLMHEHYTDYLWKDEAVDARRFGKGIKVGVVRDPSYLKAAKFVRDCGRQPVSAPLPSGRVLGEDLQADLQTIGGIEPIRYAQARV